MEPKQPIPKYNEEGSFLFLFFHSSEPTEVKTKQDIETWLNDEDCLDMWEELKGRSVETIYSYSKDDLVQIAGGSIAKGAGLYNWLHPSQGMLHEGQSYSFWLTVF